MALADHLRTNEFDIAGLITPETPFWCGLDKMAAPHLPVGSPERTALFKALRESFSWDWDAAEEAAFAERCVNMGDLYFMVAGSAVKIGHSRNVAKRLRHIQTHNHEAVILTVHLQGQGWRESEFHHQFREHQLRGEWFERCPEIEAEIERLNSETGRL